MAWFITFNICHYCSVQYFHEIGPLWCKVCQTIMVCVFCSLVAKQMQKIFNSILLLQKRKCRLNYSFDLLFVDISVFERENEKIIWIHDSWSCWTQSDHMQNSNWLDYTLDLLLLLFNKKVLTVMPNEIFAKSGGKNVSQRERWIQLELDLLLKEHKLKVNNSHRSFASQ